MRTLSWALAETLREQERSGVLAELETLTGGDPFFDHTDTTVSDDQGARVCDLPGELLAEARGRQRDDGIVD